MNQHLSAVAPSGSAERELALLVEEWTAHVEEGATPDLEAFVAAHPVHADELRRLLPALELLAGLSGTGNHRTLASEENAPETLGDFRIVREIGRGGMGVVYEAEQLSLRRRVALKVLPFAGILDPRQLQRFRNEAQAAARLHHGNIVPVYFVGCERGTHFYAMQLIEGQTLAAVIRALRNETGEPGTKVPAERRAPEPPAEGDPTVPHVHAPAVTAETLARTSLSTDGPRRGREYFRKVAQLGVQAAEALDYAHQMGVLHRDIKPANLMLDARGTLWVTDFGLAQMQHGDGSLTMTGDLVGTLRYMSPEQATGKRVIIDQRTDVYSLGATLYELLTLRPAFGGSDRQELLRQVAFDEPMALRRVDRSIPVELETIVLKAMEKNPLDRYATAQELADDLGRWLEDRPIKARRPSMRQVAAKWVRRHKAAVWEMAMVLLVLAVVGGANWLWWMQKRAGAEGEARAALQEAMLLQKKEKWLEALSAVRRAKGILAGVWADQDLRKQVDETEKDLEMVLRIEEARLRLAELKEGGFDWEASDEGYRESFRWYDLDVEHLDPEEAGQRIRSRPIQAHLVAALDDWALVRSQFGHKGLSQLLVVARLADQGSDPRRDMLRDVLEGKAILRGKKLATAGIEEWSPATAVFQARVVRGTPEAQQAQVILLQAWQRHPADFWINHELAFSHFQSHPRRLEEAIRFYTTAVALRPDNAGVRLNLGWFLYHKGRLDEAITEYEHAIQLKKEYPAPHHNLGVALQAKGKLDEAIAAYQQAILLKHDYTEAHYNLALLLLGKGKKDEAIDCLRKAIASNPKHVSADYNLGIILRTEGKDDEAMVCFRKAIEIDPKRATAYAQLGIILCDRKHDYDQAISCFRKAIEIDPKSAETHYNLGQAMLGKGREDDAIACYRSTIALDSTYGDAYVNLAHLLKERGEVQEAITYLHQAVVRAPKCANAHYNLAQALYRQGKTDEAIVSYRKTIESDPKHAKAHNQLGDILLRKDRVDEAIAYLRKAIEINPNYATAHCNLGIAKWKQGKMEEALAGFRKAVEIDSTIAEAHYNLGLALGHLGKVDDVIAAYRAAIRCDKEHAKAHCNLGLLMLKGGQFQEAVQLLRRGHQLGNSRPGWSYPSAEWLREAERMAQFQERLRGVLAGKDKPRDAAEWLGFARVCQLSEKRFAVAVRFYSKAFASDPGLFANPESGVRYDAACAAALAGCGHGKDAADLSEKERSDLRHQALAWLQADLKAWRRLLDERPMNSRPAIMEQLRHWLVDADFAGVHGELALEKLPEAEQQGWQKLWILVANTLARAQGKTTPATKPKAK